VGPSGNQDDRLGIDDLKGEGFGKERSHSVEAELYLQLRGKLPVSGRAQCKGRRGYQIGTGFSFGLSYIMAMNIDNGLYIGTRSGLGQSAKRRKAGKRDERIPNNSKEQKWDSGKDQRIYWIKESCLPKTFSKKQKPRPKSWGEKELLDSRLVSLKDRSRDALRRPKFQE
jgi:hypothetical protein